MEFDCFFADFRSSRLYFTRNYIITSCNIIQFTYYLFSIYAFKCVKRTKIGIAEHILCLKCHPRRVPDY